MADDFEARKKELELRELAAKAASAEAAALKARRDASAVDLKVDVPEQTLDVGDKASPVAELVAYAELGDVGAAVVDEINRDVDKGLGGALVLMVRSLDLAKDHGTYVLLKSTTDRLAAALIAEAKRLAPPVESRDVENSLKSDIAERISSFKGVKALGFHPVTAGLSALTSLGSTALAFLRTDTTVRSRDVTLKESAVYAAVANQLLNADASVMLAGFSPVPSNEIVSGFGDLQAGRDRLEDLRAMCQRKVDGMTPDVAAEKERLSALRKTRDKKVGENPPHPTDDVDGAIARLVEEIAAAEARLQEAQGKVASAKRLIDQVDAFSVAVQEAPAGGLPPLLSAALWHELFTATDRRYVLFVEALFAGGESTYRDKDVGRDKAQHVGGVAVSFHLADLEGHIRSSGLVTRLGATSHTVGDPKYAHWSSSLRETEQ